MGKNPRWKTFSREIGLFAETVVLPKRRRTKQPACEFAALPMEEPGAQDAFIPIDPDPAEEIEPDPAVEIAPAQAAQALAQPVAAPAQEQPETGDPDSQFPIFMLVIFAIEVVLKYTVSEEDLVMYLAFDPHRRHEIWRFISIMLVHTGIAHLWINVFFQLVLGILLEIVHGWKRIGAIYISSVIGGSMFVTILNPKTYVIGASAGVYGLLLAHLATIIINWNDMERKKWRLFGLFAFVIADIGWSVFCEFFWKVAGSDSNTSHASHLGGAITGFMVSTFVLKHLDNPRWEERLEKTCIIVLIALGVIIAIVNVTVWDMYVPTEFNFDYLSTYENYLMKLIVDSPENSQMRKLCEMDEGCKETLDQYNFNGTFSS